MSNLFEPVTVGKWVLSNRIAMAPMTRNRAYEGRCRRRSVPSTTGSGPVPA